MRAVVHLCVFRVWMRGFVGLVHTRREGGYLPATEQQSLRCIHPLLHTQHQYAILTTLTVVWFLRTGAVGSLPTLAAAAGVGGCWVMVTVGGVVGGMGLVALLASGMLGGVGGVMAVGAVGAAGASGVVVSTIGTEGAAGAAGAAGAVGASGTAGLVGAVGAAGAVTAEGAGGAEAGGPQPLNCARVEPATGVSLMPPICSTTVRMFWFGWCVCGFGWLRGERYDIGLATLSFGHICSLPRQNTAHALSSPKMEVVLRVMGKVKGSPVCACQVKKWSGVGMPVFCGCVCERGYGDKSIWLMKWADGIGRGWMERSESAPTYSSRLQPITSYRIETWKRRPHFRRTVDPLAVLALQRDHPHGAARRAGLDLEVVVVRALYVHGLFCGSVIDGGVDG